MPAAANAGGRRLTKNDKVRLAAGQPKDACLGRTEGLVGHLCSNLRNYFRPRTRGFSDHDLRLDARGRIDVPKCLIFSRLRLWRNFASWAKGATSVALNCCAGSSWVLGADAFAAPFVRVHRVAALDRDGVRGVLGKPRKRCPGCRSKNEREGENFPPQPRSSRLRVMHSRRSARFLRPYVVRGRVCCPGTRRRRSNDERGWKRSINQL